VKRVLLIAVLSAWSSSAAWAESYSCLIVFGDSLSDTGNAWLASDGAYPPAGYYQGRYSNGPLWVEDLAAALHLPNPDPAWAGGTNYAISGARTGNSFGSMPGVDLPIPGVAMMVNDYINSLDQGRTDPNALYTMCAGGNDFLNTLGDSPTEAELAACAENLATWAGNLVNAIDALHTAGAVNFVVPNLRPVSNTPRFSSSPYQTEINALVVEFNQDLFAGLTTLENLHSDLQIQMVDTYGLYSQIFANPANYGLENVTDPAMTTLGADPDKYLFWDDIHPTAAAHALLADAVMGTVPEPSSMVLLTVGALCFAAARACCRQRKAV
jgi:phospholipase/lecithinase/hemolysin